MYENRTLDKDLLLSTTAFDNVGGWTKDSQFVLTMGGAYLLAHGLGKPVADATTTFQVANNGRYHVYAYTFNWVSPWHEDMAPGTFHITIDGNQESESLGNTGRSWMWQDAGYFNLEEGIKEIRIVDEQGFEGRCAYIYLTEEENPELPTKSDEVLNFYLSKVIKNKYEIHVDFCTIGGGFGGMCASLASARGGLKTALIQDRPMVGGNNSSEVRVWLGGGTNYEPFPGVGNIVGEFEQKRIGHYGSVNKADLYEDEKKMAIMNSEENLQMFTETVLYSAEMDGSRIKAVNCYDYVNEKLYHIEADLFCDSSGDGNLAAMAGADYEITTNGHMGMSNLWHVEKTGNNVEFPRCPWAIDLSKKNFPGRGDTIDIYGKKREFSMGCWFWEAGMTEHPIEKMEYARDVNFRAMYGAWDTVRNVDHDYEGYELTFSSPIAGKRESRRILGDVVLTKADFKYTFPDACAATTWDFDVHYPDKDFYDCFEEHDAFLTMDCREKVNWPYFLPYRILYSRNVDNLYMAGRDVSVSHDASGTARVMRTCGIMGEIVGYATRFCKKYSCSPREIYTEHLEEFLSFLKGIEKKETFKVGSTVV